MDATLLLLIITIAGLAFTFLLPKLRGKIHKEIDENVDDQKMAGILHWLNDAAFTVVNAVQQEVVQEAKRKAVDGKLSDQDIADIQKEAVSRLKLTVPKVSAEFLKKQVETDDSLDKLYSTVISGALNKAKTEGYIPSGQKASSFIPAGVVTITEDQAKKLIAETERVLTTIVPETKKVKEQVEEAKETVSKVAEEAKDKVEDAISDAKKVLETGVKSLTKKKKK